MYNILTVKILNWEQFLSQSKQYITYTKYQIVVILFVAVAVFGLLCVYQKKLYADRKVIIGIPCKLAASLWIAFVIGVTLINREIGDKGVILELSRTFGPTIRGDVSSQHQIISNILLFIPLGVLLPLNIYACRKWHHNAFVCLLATLIIEFTQLITRRGVFDVGDIVTNFVGGMLGYWIYVIGSRFVKKLEERHR